MVKISLQNRGMGTADIVSYTGRMLHMQGQQVMPLDFEDYSADLEQYYKQLNKVGIYLLKREEMPEAVVMQVAEAVEKEKPKAEAAKKSETKPTKKATESE